MGMGMLMRRFEPGVFLLLVLLVMKGVCVCVLDACSLVDCCSFCYCC
jgi:hypothetical protein